VQDDWSATRIQVIRRPRCNALKKGTIDSIRAIAGEKAWWYRRTTASSRRKRRDRLLSVVEILCVLDEILPFEVGESVVRAGGYGSIQEAVDDVTASGQKGVDQAPPRRSAHMKQSTRSGPTDDSNASPHLAEKLRQAREYLGLSQDKGAPFKGPGQRRNIESGQRRLMHWSSKSCRPLPPGRELFHRDEDESVLRCPPT